MLALLDKQPTPATDNLEVLTAIIDKFDLDMDAIWGLIDAFNFGVICGKREERAKN